MNEASNFYASSSLAHNPVSSWGYKSENPINSSGVTFAVRFMGYVPIPRTIAHRPAEEKDALVRLCINSVVSCNASEQFRQLLSHGDVGPYVSVHKLEVFLNIANFTITFFHIQDGRSFLLGRYMNDQISHYKERIIDNVYYLGLVMRNQGNEKRECNILMLDNVRVRDELIAKLQNVDGIDHAPMYRLEARLRSTQDYAYKLEMLSCYHGNLPHAEAISRLSKDGDFLVRNSVATPGTFTVTYKTGSSCAHSPIPVNNINLFKQFQVQESKLKFPVLRYDF